MGVANMKSIQYSGTGWQGVVGQNYAPADDWPRVDLTSYTRTIDFDTMSSREEFVRVQGSNPGRGGGVPVVGEQRVTNFVSGNYAWTLNAQGQPVPQPADAELRRLDIFLTPWGFLKGAMAPGANPTMVTRNEYGGRVRQFRSRLAVDPIHVRQNGLLEDWGCDPPSPQGARCNCTVTPG